MMTVTMTISIWSLGQDRLTKDGFTSKEHNDLASSLPVAQRLEHRNSDDDSYDSYDDKDDDHGGDCEGDDGSDNETFMQRLDLGMTND